MIVRNDRVVREGHLPSTINGAQSRYQEIIVRSGFRLNCSEKRAHQGMMGVGNRRTLVERIS